MMSRHTYGNYVIRHLIEYGLPQHRQHVVDALLKDETVWRSLVRNDPGSRVVDTALEFGSFAEQQKIAAELFKTPDELVAIAKSSHGHNVIRRLLNLPGEYGTKVADCLRPCRDDLHLSRYGRIVL